MEGAADPNQRRRRADVALFLGILVLTVIVRRPSLATRELWLDEMTRVRQSFMSWDAIWHRLPYIDPIKSPYAILFHKAWTAVAGTGSILAMRGYGALLGVALVAATYWAARAAFGRWAAFAAALLVAVDPFYVRHSIEIHTYSAAALCVIAAWALALGTPDISRRRAMAVCALGGVAVGTFPGTALGLLPIVLVPSVRRFRDRTALAAGLALAVAIALPPLLNIRESAAIHAPAYAAGIAWSPFFSLRTTPFEVFARLAGLDRRQGSASDADRWGTIVVVGFAVAALLLSRPAAGEREGWRKRAALLAAGLLPPVVLAIVSSRGVSVFNDRYIHATSSLLPVAFVGAIESGLLAARAGPRGRIAAAAAALAAAAVLVTLALGIRKMIDLGSAFPSDTTSYLYRCNGLVEEVAKRDGMPAVLLVHGEAQASQVLLRVPKDLLDKTDLRHLTTHAWVEIERDGHHGEVAIPHAYGWPFGLTEFAGHSISVDPADAGALIREKKTAWVVLERERVNRQRQHEEEETPVLDEAVDRLDQPPSAERDRVISAAVVRYLGLSAETWTRVESGPWIAIVELRVP